MYTLQYPFPKTNIGEELNKTKDRGKQYFYTLFWHFEFTFLVPPLSSPFKPTWFYLPLQPPLSFCIRIAHTICTGFFPAIPLFLQSFALLLHEGSNLFARYQRNSAKKSASVDFFTIIHYFKPLQIFRSTFLAFNIQIFKRLAHTSFISCQFRMQIFFSSS